MAMKQRQLKTVTEFGDFQTPPDLARAAARALVGIHVRPRSILEPTCGKGAFIKATSEALPDAESIVGIDINSAYLAEAETPDHRVELRQGDFFQLKWERIVIPARAPWLIIGNPPWVTSSKLGAIASGNLPEKSNFHGRQGIEAITGKSNFDISEWMLLRYLDWLEGDGGTIAVLCKTAVARKILHQAWKRRYPLRAAYLYRIDALAYFGVAVDACFFVLQIQPGSFTSKCDEYESLEAARPSHTIGFSAGHIITDMASFSRQRHLFGPEDRYTWRSGVKHDCSKVMELSPEGGQYRNGLGESVTLEDTLLFPMLKSSDIGNGRLHPRGVMLVTQRQVGQDTADIEQFAPAIWRYLRRHAEFFERRGSSIYRNKPPFSVFGVGSYTFAPWKVAISGFYKKLQFEKIGPVAGRPVVFDDTVYFLPCWSPEEASFLHELLSSEIAGEFYRSMIHWNDKRPITADILKRLSLGKLAANLGRQEEYAHYTAPAAPSVVQLSF